MKRPSLGQLRMVGGLSLGLVVALTVLGGIASEIPIGKFLVYETLLAVLMIFAARGLGWARWIVTGLLLFIAASTLRGGGALGFLLAAVFGASAVVFFRYRPGPPPMTSPRRDDTNTD